MTVLIARQISYKRVLESSPVTREEVTLNIPNSVVKPVSNVLRVLPFRNVMPYRTAKMNEMVQGRTVQSAERLTLRETWCGMNEDFSPAVSEASSSTGSYLIGFIIL